MNFNFGNRKIQKVRYSFLIPLPVEWIKNMNIGKGNLLNIEMQDDYSLIITPALQARQDSEGTGSATPIN
jgi:antitoxin component of MazEF toxin-antitoxin module